MSPSKFIRHQSTTHESSAAIVKRREISFATVKCMSKIIATSTGANEQSSRHVIKVEEDAAAMHALASSAQSSKEENAVKLQQFNPTVASVRSLITDKVEYLESSRYLRACSIVEKKLRMVKVLEHSFSVALSVAHKFARAQQKHPKGECESITRSSHRHSQFINEFVVFVIFSRHSKRKFYVVDHRLSTKKNVAA